MSVEAAFHFLHVHFKFLWSKLLISLLPAGIFIITDTHREVLAIVLWLIIIDTILGVAIAIRFKKVRSSRMIKAIHKFLLYMTALATAYLISCLDVPVVGYFYLYVGAFLATTEGISIFEKLSIFGLNLPKKFLSKLNDDFNDIEKMKKNWMDKK